MDLTPALEIFIAEAGELLEQMEQSLLLLEHRPGDRELLDAVFRTAHTIKGSAGMFGFNTIVAHTHQLENLLDLVRAGEVALTPALSALLLRCGDHLGTLVTPAVDNLPLQPAVSAVGEALERELAQYLPALPNAVDRHSMAADVALLLASGAPPATPSAAALPTSLAADYAVFLASAEPALAQPAALVWRIALQFGADVLRNGMDPLSILHYLGTVGEIVNLTTLWGRLPPLVAMDPESCYLDVALELATTADRAVIDAVFDFIRDDCKIQLTPPSSQVRAQLADLAALPEGPSKLGEILVAAHALTDLELAAALAEQAAESRPPVAPGGPRPLGRILVDAGAVPEPVVDAALERQQQARLAKAQDSKLIRVDAEKLDQLITLVGELVIAGSGTFALAQHAKLGDIVESAAALLRLVEQVRDNALSLRMVPIAATFQRFQRVVRDVSLDLGKDIELVIAGAETELDKSVVERIGDPLMHLVRNAMDHGIENAARRLASGKPARAKISLNAYHDSGSIVIEVADDGGGLPLDKIRHKAIERGLLAASANPTPQEIQQLVFEAGFSTAEAVSNLSGRGVGMDVVRRSIETLRGMIEIDSTEGLGTLVRIRLPLTLAIIDGFMVGLGAARYVLPLDVVVECMELSEADRCFVSERGFINVRGAVLPVVRLRDAFALNDATEGAAAHAQGAVLSRRENIVVVRFGALKAGLVVDELFGEFQTVIKPLGKLFSYLQGISGSTILGSGEVALILDVPGLIKRVERTRPPGRVVA
ncbi:MAG: chemotaxis protein CheA [Gammaproteobacteria bacterium]|nr:chemotaxis protein CheA [Gammaproteobacteria bacterium]